MDLNELRQEIDQIDDQLVKLFCQRMDVAARVADYKRENNLPIFHPGRERAILQKVAEKAGPEMGNYTRVLYSMLFELSRSYQAKRNDVPSPLYQQISQSIETTPKLFPQTPIVACQGGKGAELCRPLQRTHPLSIGGIGVWQMNDIVVIAHCVLPSQAL